MAGETNVNADTLRQIQIEQVILKDNNNLDNTTSSLIIQLFKDKKSNYCHLIETQEDKL